jgi:hypothetical protein
MQELVLDGQSFKVARRTLVYNCELFADNPSLLTKPYAVQSRVSIPSFRVLVNAISGHDVDITSDNVRDLALLSSEFKFTSFSQSVAAYQAAHPALDASRALAEQLRSHDRALCAHDKHIDGLDAALGRLHAEVLTLTAAVAGVQRENERLASEMAASRRREGQLEQENRRLWESSEGLRKQLARVELEQHKATAIAKEGLMKVQEEVAQLREEKKPSRGPAGPPVQQKPKATRRFPPTVKKVKAGVEVPDGIIAHLTRECGGNVQDCSIVSITSSEVYKTDIYDCSAKNVADLEADSFFCSDFRADSEDIAHKPNNWVCYDFKARQVDVTGYSIRSCASEWAGGSHPKSWMVETSHDGKTWTTIDRRENTSDLDDYGITATFKVDTNSASRFVKLVNIGRTHYGDDALIISGFEVFGSLTE